MPKRKRVQVSTSRVTRVQDVIDVEETTSYLVRNRRGRELFRQPKPIFQKYDRDVLNALTNRWVNDQPCCSLNTENVKLRDNTAFLPVEGRNGSKQYPKIFLQYLTAVHGVAGNFRARDDLYAKLKEPNLTLEEFKNLYFHSFLQSEEELADFPARIVDNIRPLKVYYEGKLCRWNTAYSSWEGKSYQRQIDLIGASMVDLLVLRVYMHGSYSNNAVSEAVLVRNVITHLNQWKLKRDRDHFDKTELLEIVYECFPDIWFKLFDFCQFCGVDIDFAKLRKFFKA